MTIEDTLRGIAYDQYRRNMASNVISFPEFYEDWAPTMAEWDLATNSSLNHNGSVYESGEPKPEERAWHSADSVIENNLGASLDKGPSQV